jgi:MYXO-CTERM domain-containing protein
MAMTSMFFNHRATSRAVRAFAGGTAIAVCAGTSLAGPDWDLDLDEDANQTAMTAQRITAGATPILSITGRLSGYGLAGGDFVDMYEIEIGSTTVLTISTAGGDLGGFANFDTQLFLFRRKGGNGNNVRAAALKGNDNAAQGNFGSRIGENENPGSNSVLLRKGVYFLAIAGVGSHAFGDEGQALWGDLGIPGATVSGNDVFLDNWTDGGAVGQYTIRLQSVSGGMIPTPGALAVFALGALASRRRRR